MMTKHEIARIADKATDYVSVAWITAWVADFINHVPWVNITAMVLCFWTIGRALWWAIVTYKRWRLNKYFTTQGIDQ